jgi:2-methylcitrate dehydratase PrpD
MAYDGEVLTEQFSESRLSDPTLLAFMKRIRIEADPEYDKGADATRHVSRMKVTARGGRVFEKDAPYRKGSPDLPMTTEERHTKFRRLATAALPASKVETIIKEVENLERAATIAPLVALLRASG